MRASMSNFNIRIVIAFCGSGTQLFQREMEPFGSATDPSRAEHAMIVPGTGDGLDSMIVNAIVQALNAKAGSASKRSGGMMQL
jgi:hypothetical protein